MKLERETMNGIVACACLLGFACLTATPGLAAEPKVVLMIGGKFCEAYLGDVDAALKKIQGVKTVDFKSVKGHVVVTIDGDKVKPDQLSVAVAGVKGDGWHCTGQVMK